MLLERKLKNPCHEDHEEIGSRSRTIDAPRKRIDKFKSSNGYYNQLTVGSPAVGRRGIIVSHGYVFYNGRFIYEFYYMNTNLIVFINEIKNSNMKID